MSSTSITSILKLGNLILSSANVIIGFSLFVYILTHNLRSAVARAFCALMAFITIVYVVDVSVANVNTPSLAENWLRLQWVGIAFVPAAYLHFSDALLRTTGSLSRWRRVGIWVGYLLGLVSLVLVLFTDLIVTGVARMDHIYHLLAGPFFWVFAVVYTMMALNGWLNIRMARNRCVTSTSRRRMGYLMLAFVAPSVGAFPYLLIPATEQYLSANFIYLLNLAGNLGVALMTVVIGYIVAYQGVLLPDRVIKHNMMHYLFRGPLVAILVIVIMLTIPRVDHIWGLPRDTVLITTVAASVVVLQLLVNVAKPAIDLLLYRRDRKEVAWIQTLDERLLTTTDLEQLLENTLIALADLLRVPSGFVVTMEGSTASIRVFCGPKEEAKTFLSQSSLPQLMELLSKSRQQEDKVTNDDFVAADGYWLVPLRSPTEHTTLGILGFRAAASEPSFSTQDLEAAQNLVQRGELALEDMRLQQGIFAVLHGMRSELDQLQEWRSSPLYVGEDTLQHFEMNPIHSTSFTEIVKDALGEFWGGPKLSQSPLLRTHLVRQRLSEHDGVPAKAVRAVLKEAIEKLRPDGKRSMTSTEWTIYNILDLKFIQGKRIRDITQQLAMSESDFYRKQRVAIAQVADILVRMEHGEKEQIEEE
ncbi:MAG: histidine kinase N-terminal 7TM domain-containing protein [Chloroflexota bacterium]|nr:histidine kinase N-terminal 7TM domain-containing protein [Chloroflexota bacterium]